MCGIVGLHDKKGSSDLRPLIERMLRFLRHRGTDAVGTEVFDGAALGHCRLSIVDLSEAANQPFQTDSGRLRITFNGEIYNHKELRSALEKDFRFRTHSDTEVLLAAYLKWGVACVDHLDGMFAFTVFDTVTKNWFGARDRLGIKPLYMVDQDRFFAVSSEIKPLAWLVRDSLKISESATISYLLAGYVPGSLSIFEGIQKLPAGTYFTFNDREGLSINEYWKPYNIEVDSSVTFGDAVDRTDELLRASIHRQSNGDVEVGVGLSGGIDSSLISAILAGSNSHLKTFSVGFENSSFDESKMGAKVAGYLNCENYQRTFSSTDLKNAIGPVFDQMNEPFADPSLFPTGLLASFAKEQLSVLLSGDGGDELFGGYPTYQAHRWFDRFGLLRRVPWGQLSKVFPIRDDNFSLSFKGYQLGRGAAFDPDQRHLNWMGIFTGSEVDRLMSSLETQTGVASHFELMGSHYHRTAQQDRTNKLLYLDLKTYLLDNILVKTDQASMTYTLEARVPFLDHRLVEFVLSLPSSVKMKGDVPKALLRAVAKRYLPEDVVSMPKKGFGMPVSQWLRADLKTAVVEALCSKNLYSGFDRSFVTALWNDFDRKKVPNHRIIWSLFVFENWRKHFYSSIAG